MSFIVGAKRRVASCFEQFADVPHFRTYDDFVVEESEGTLPELRISFR